MKTPISKLKHPLVIGALCIGAIIFFLNSKFRSSNEVETSPIETSNPYSGTEPATEVPRSESNKKAQPLASADETAGTIDALTVSDFGRTARRELSLETTGEFTQTAHLQMDLPEQLDFTPLELDDESVAIYGSSHLLGIDMAVIAHPTSATPQQALRYLQENLGAIPNASKFPITNFTPPTNLPESADNGLKNSTMWSAKRADGSDLHVVFMTRSDNRGSYMMVVSGPADYFQQNDGYFDKLYSSTRALPPK